MKPKAFETCLPEFENDNNSFVSFFNARSYTLSLPANLSSFVLLMQSKISLFNVALVLRRCLFSPVS